METVQREVRSASVIAIVSLVLAGCAALSLALSDMALRAALDSDALIVLTFMLGWALLAWASIGVIVAVVRVLRVGDFRRRATLVESAFVLAAIMVILAAIFLYPFVSHGSSAA